MTRKKITKNKKHANIKKGDNGNLFVERKMWKWSAVAVHDAVDFRRSGRN